jgi:hypothetical protein
MNRKAKASVRPHALPTKITYIRHVLRNMSTSEEDKDDVTESLGRMSLSSSSRAPTPPAPTRGALPHTPGMLTPERYASSSVPTEFVSTIASRMTSSRPTRNAVVLLLASIECGRHHLGTKKDKPYLCVVDLSKPEQNQDFGIDFVEGIKYEAHTRKGIDIHRLIPIILDYDLLWEAIIPDEWGVCNNDLTKVMSKGGDCGRHEWPLVCVSWEPGKGNPEGNQQSQLEAKN